MLSASSLPISRQRNHIGNSPQSSQIQEVTPTLTFVSRLQQRLKELESHANPCQLPERVGGTRKLGIDCRQRVGDGIGGQVMIRDDYVKA